MAASVAVVAVIIAGAVWGGALVSAAAQAAARDAAAEAAAALAAEAVATPEPDAPLPRVAAVRGSADGWATPPRAQIAAVLPAVGTAHSGGISMLVSAPVVDAPVDALSATVAVAPSTKYRLQAHVRSLQPGTSVPAARISVGASEMALPEVGAQWTPVEMDITTGPNDASIAVRLIVDAAISPLGIDDITLTDAEGGQVIPNPSFETVSSEYGIVNDSLILATDAATMGVSLPAGDATWKVSAVTGATDPIAQGVASIDQAVTAIELAGVPQGYYQFEVTDSAGASTSTPIALVDMAGLSLKPDVRFGVGLHIEREWYEDAGPLTASLGIGEARNDVLWRINETTRGVYDFSRYAESFAELHTSGVKLLAIVDYNNKLYDGNKTVESVEGLRAFGAYAAAIAQEFDLIGLEVFNEFNYSSSNTTSCGKTADCYMPMLESVYSAVKEVRPDLPVVAGATALYDRAWFQQLWPLGAERFADAMSFHPYEVVDSSPALGRPDDLAKIVETAQSDMTELSPSGTALPIWITEVGWSTKTGGAPLEQQGNMLVRSFLASSSSGAEKLMYYDLVNDKPDAAEHEGNFGLFFQKVAGVSAYPPKPAAFSQALLASNIADLPLSRVDRPSPDTTAMTYGFGEDTVNVAWTSTGSHTLTYVARGTVEVTSLDGSVSTLEPVDGRVSVPVGDSPAFITGALMLAAD